MRANHVRGAENSKKRINSALSRVTTSEELSEDDLYHWLVKYEHVLKAIEAFPTLNLNGSNASEVVETIDGHFSIMDDRTVAGSRTKDESWYAFKKRYKDYPSHRFIEIGLEIERQTKRQMAFDFRVIELKTKDEGCPATNDVSDLYGIDL